MRINIGFQRLSEMLSTYSTRSSINSVLWPDPTHEWPAWLRRDMIVDNQPLKQMNPSHAEKERPIVQVFAVK